MNDVTKPRKENEWQLKENGSIVNDEQEIANTFKTFFVDKIRTYKCAEVYGIQWSGGKSQKDYSDLSKLQKEGWRCESEPQSW